MRKKGIILLLAFILLSNQFFLSDGFDDIQTELASRDDSHDSFLQVNVSYENLTPAESVLVNVNRWISKYSGLNNHTNSNGVVTYTLEPQMWGLNYINVANDSEQYNSISKIIIEPDRTYYLDLLLTKPTDVNVVTGTVRNKSNGQPIQGIEVEFFGYDCSNYHIHNTTMTDSQGRYVINFPSNIETFGTHVKNESYHYFGRSYYFIESISRYSINMTLEPIISYKNNITISYYYEETNESIIDPPQIILSGWSNIRDQEIIFSKYDPLILDPGPSGYYFINNLEPGNYYIDWEKRMTDVSFTNRQFIFFNGTSQEYRFPINIETDFIDMEFIVRNESTFLEDVSVRYEETCGKNFLNIYSAYRRTDSEGKTVLKLLSDRITNISFSKNYYTQEPKYLQISPTNDMATKVIYLVRDYQDVDEKPKGKINISLVDKKSGIGIKAKIGFYTSVGYKRNYETNDKGILLGEIETGFYPFVAVETNLCEYYMYNLTVSEDHNENLTFQMVRKTYWDYYSFRFVDEETDFISSSAFHGGVYGRYTTYYTNDQGILRIPARPGMVTFYQQESDRYKFGILRDYLFLNGSGGRIQDIQVYRSSPLFEVSGFIKDSINGKSIFGASINTRSHFILSENQGISFPGIDEEPLLFQQDLGSDISGYYRIGGRKDLFLFVEKEGYYPKYEKIEVMSTLKNSHDIYLDPIPEEKIRIYGSIIDDEDNPISGYISVFEDEHPYTEIYRDETIKGEGFSLLLFKGNFTIFYGNDSMSDVYHLEVIGPGPYLELPLSINSVLDIKVRKWNNTPAGHFLVTIEEDQGNSEFFSFDWGITNNQGNIQFILPEGTYRIIIEPDPFYEEYISEPIHLYRKTHSYLNITLMNRTSGKINGEVMGANGPEIKGIPGAKVILSNETNSINRMVLTDINGKFSISELNYSTYSILVTPPDNLSFIPGNRSGYVSFTSIIHLNKHIMNLDIDLEFKKNENLNITYNSPIGENISLDQPIIIKFSHQVNLSILKECIEIEPELKNLSFQYTEENKTVRIDHDLFHPNTTFSVTIKSTIRSIEGFKAWNDKEYIWNFKSKEMSSDWIIYTTSIFLEDNLDLNVSVEGYPDLKVFFIIEGVGSFLIEEVVPGIYEAEIKGSNFSWDTQYFYYFTYSSDGPIINTTLSGSFTTPNEPNNSNKWHIEYANIELNGKEWSIEVQGNSDLIIYIVVNGVGSFQLKQGIPGNYTLTIEADFFEWDTIYDYHFSDKANGSTPIGYERFSGSIRTPKEDKNRDSLSILIFIGILAILLVGIIVIIFILIRRNKILSKISEE